MEVLCKWIPFLMFLDLFFRVDSMTFRFIFIFVLLACYDKSFRLGWCYSLIQFDSFICVCDCIIAIRYSSVLLVNSLDDNYFDIQSRIPYFYGGDVLDDGYSRNLLLMSDKHISGSFVK